MSNDKIEHLKQRAKEEIEQDLARLDERVFKKIAHLKLYKNDPTLRRYLKELEHLSESQSYAKIARLVSKTIKTISGKPAKCTITNRAYADIAFVTPFRDSDHIEVFISSKVFATYPGRLFVAYLLFEYACFVLRFRTIPKLKLRYKVATFLAGIVVAALYVWISHKITKDTKKLINHILVSSVLVPIIWLLVGVGLYSSKILRKYQWATTRIASDIVAQYGYGRELAQVLKQKHYRSKTFKLRSSKLITFLAKIIPSLDPQEPPEKQICRVYFLALKQVPKDSAEYFQLASQIKADNCQLHL